jgi:hypothetical protein
VRGACARRIAQAQLPLQGQHQLLLMHDPEKSQTFRSRYASRKQ